MLKPGQMKKLLILCTKQNQEAMIGKLYDLNVVHIIDHKKTEKLDIGSPLEDAEKISSLLIKVRAFISNFGIQKSPGNPLNIAQIGQRVNVVDEKYKAMAAKLKETENELSMKAQALEKLAVIDSLCGVEALKDYKTLSVFIGRTNAEADELKAKIRKITTKYYMANTKDSVAVFAEKEKAQKVLEVLKSYGFSEMNYSDIIQNNFTDSKKLSSDIKVLKTAKAKLELEIREMAEENAQFLTDAEKALDAELEKAEAPLKFASTKETVLIYGWVPEKRLAKVKAELGQVSKSIYFAEKDIERGENVPVELDNPKIVQPFEFFMNLYTLPKYYEYDPTIFMFITFPIFFGLMLGDVAYGFITLAIFLYLKKKMPSAKMLLNAMIMASVMTIIFGAVFGEYLGYETIPMNSPFAFVGNALHFSLVNVEGHYAYNIPGIIQRTHDNLGGIPLVLIIGAVLGVIHLNFGLAIGFVQKLKRHGLKHAVFEKLSWVVLQIAFGLTIASLMKIISLPIYIGIIVLLGALGMLYMGEGAKGLVEFPAIFSNILSYMRLGAVGLASVYLALVINEYLAGPFFEKGGIFIAVAVLIMVIGHAVNIGLGIIGPFLHSLRLHYVEFFSKFYEGGGLRFKPFGSK